MKICFEFLILESTPDWQKNLITHPCNEKESFLLKCWGVVSFNWPKSTSGCVPWYSRWTQFGTKLWYWSWHSSSLPSLTSSSFFGPTWLWPGSLWCLTHVHFSSELLLDIGSKCFITIMVSPASLRNWFTRALLHSPGGWEDEFERKIYKIRKGSPHQDIWVITPHMLMHVPESLQSIVLVHLFLLCNPWQVDRHNTYKTSYIDTLKTSSTTYSPMYSTGERE